MFFWVLGFLELPEGDVDSDSTAANGKEAEEGEVDGCKWRSSTVLVLNWIDAGRDGGRQMNGRCLSSVVWKGLVRGVGEEKPHEDTEAPSTEVGDEVNPLRGEGTLPPRRRGAVRMLGA